MQIIRTTGTSLLALGLLGWMGQTPAQAHFLWATLSEARRPALTLRFTEQPGEQTLPDLRERIRPTRLIAASQPHTPLTASDNGKEAVLPAGTEVAGAEQVWGVMDRTAQGRGLFLLHYHAKAASSLKAATTSSKLPVEIFVKRHGETYVASVFHNGKPVSLAELFVYRPGNENALALKTDKKGEARFSTQHSGLCGLRALVEENKSGTYEGKEYRLIRHYSTLTLPVTANLITGAADKSDTPNEKDNPETVNKASDGKEADPAAYALLKAAHDRRYRLPSTVTGLRGEVVLNDRGNIRTGTFTYGSGGAKVELTDASATQTEWLRGQISNLIGHRRGGDFAKGDGSHPITFTEDSAENPLGRQVRLNDTLRSEYRVQDKTVVEVTRSMGDQRFTITVLETLNTPDGRYLPRHFVVAYFREKTGEVQRVETFTDTFREQNGVWLPVSRRLVVAENGLLFARTFELKNVTLEK